jgi:hypothetical protein
MDTFQSAKRNAKRLVEQKKTWKECILGLNLGCRLFINPCIDPTASPSEAEAANLIPKEIKQC